MTKRFAFLQNFKNFYKSTFKFTVDYILHLPIYMYFYFEKCLASGKTKELCIKLSAITEKKEFQKTFEKMIDLYLHYDYMLSFSFYKRDLTPDLRKNTFVTEISVNNFLLT